MTASDDGTRDRVAIVGAGTMGPMLALVFASGGHPVALTDIDGKALEAAFALARGNARAWLGDAAPVCEKIEAQPDLAQAVEEREVGV